MQRDLGIGLPSEEAPPRLEGWVAPGASVLSGWGGNCRQTCWGWNVG